MDKRIVATAVVALLVLGAYVAIISFRSGSTPSPTTRNSSTAQNSSTTSTSPSSTTSQSTSTTQTTFQTSQASTAKREATEYFLTTIANSSEGSIVVAPTPTLTDGGYAPGTIVSLRAVPNNQQGSFTFLKWAGSVDGTSNPLEIRLESNRTAQAEFFNNDVLLSLAPSCPTSVVPSSPTTSEQPPASGGVSLNVVGQVGGVTQAVAAEGSYAYVGVGSRVTAFDISNPTSMTELGSTAPLKGTVTGIAINGSTAIVTAGGGGFYIVGLGNPAKPQVLGGFQTSGYAEGAAISGGYAFIADGPDGLQIFDVSNPTTPKLVGNAYNLNYVFGVSVAGGAAYLASADSGILTVNIANPSNPVETGQLALPGSTFAVAVSGETAIVAGGWGGLQVVDVASATQPKLIGGFNTSGWAMGVDEIGGLLYVAEGESGLQIYRLQGTSLDYIGGFHTSGSSTVAVAVTGNLALLADSNEGVAVVDVSTPSQPRILGEYESLSGAESVGISGGYIYVGSTNGLVRAVNLANPDSPQELGDFTASGFPGAVTASNGYAYVPTLNLEALYPLNVTDPSDLNPVSPIPLTFNTPGGEFGGLTAGAPRGAFIQGSTLYIADEKGMIIYDVSNPLSPCMLGHIPASSTLVNGAVTNVFINVVVDNGLAFISAGKNPTTVIVNVANPRDPQVIGQFDFASGGSNGVAFYGHTLYILGNNYLYAVNTTNPAQATEISDFALPTPSNDVYSATQLVSYSQGKLLVLDGSTLDAVDVSNPAGMAVSGSLALPYPASWVGANGSYIYVADNQGGVLVVQMSSGGPQTSPATKGGLTSSTGTTPSNTRHRSFLASWMEQVGLLMRNALVFLQGTLAPVAAWATPVKTPSLAATTPSDPGCVVTSTGDSGPGTLRACVEQAALGEHITFSPADFQASSPATIYLTSQLIISTELVINGTGAGVIVNGSQATPGTSAGIALGGDGVTLQGLEIVDFPSAGVSVAGAHDVIKGDVISGNHDDGVLVCCGPSAASDLVVGSFIGTTPTGTEVLGSQNQGITLSGVFTTVGGNEPSQRNILSGNLITDVVGTDTYGNVIEGNYIGLDSSGEHLLGSPSGQEVTLQVNSSSNLVMGNIIGGGFDLNIIDPGSQFNVITSNYFGLDATGTTELAPVMLGVSTPYNVIGGAQPGERNVIAGDIQITAPNVFVLGNYFGTNAKGDIAFQGTDKTIFLRGGVHDFIGGMGSGGGNLMVSNNGIQVTQGSLYDFVMGNTMGLTTSGQTGQKLGVDISIQTSEHIFVEGNNISGSYGCGTCLLAGADYNVIRANAITNNHGVGLNATSGTTGNTVYGNSFSGNGINAYDGGQSNHWDNGSSGNYWSDYTGVNRGDGIGSTPYYIKPNGTDGYPLILPPV